VKGGSYFDIVNNKFIPIESETMLPLISFNGLFGFHERTVYELSRWEISKCRDFSCRVIGLCHEIVVLENGDLYDMIKNKKIKWRSDNVAKLNVMDDTITLGNELFPVLFNLSQEMILPKCSCKIDSDISSVVICSTVTSNRYTFYPYLILGMNGKLWLSIFTTDNISIHNTVNLESLTCADFNHITSIWSVVNGQIAAGIGIFYNFNFQAACFNEVNRAEYGTVVCCSREFIYCVDNNDIVHRRRYDENEFHKTQFMLVRKSNPFKFPFSQKLTNMVFEYE
jgi:hypothetical protein